MRNYSFTVRLIAALALIPICVPVQTIAEVSDQDFANLKAMVEQLNTEVQTLKTTHEEDQDTIHKLQQKVGRTEETAADAKQEATAASAAATAAAQATPAPSNATHDFMVVGDAEVQYGQVLHPSQHASFVLADFAPIFLFRTSENVLFEAGFDVSLSNNAPNGSGYATNIGLSFATLDYMYNDYLTAMLGNILLPLGTYSERGAGWLNKFPDDPLSRSILPENGTGIELRGAFPLGQQGQSLTYALFGVNGPSSIDTTSNASQLDLFGNTGNTSAGVRANLHEHPAGGGRIGWFYPWKPHYDLELGISGEFGPWDNAETSLWYAAVVDAAVHISPYVEIKGEYMNTWVQSSDMGTIQPRGWWIQGGYKLAGLNLDVPFISNVELVARYDTVKDGLLEGVGSGTDRISAGLVYYITNTLWFEGDYEWLHSYGPNALPSQAYILQMSYGF
jgi:hypothetical protein